MHRQKRLTKQNLTKMRNILLFFGLLTILFVSCNQPNAEDILKKSFEKCQSVENGYYEMVQYMKFMTHKDTVTKSFNCYFNKLPDDSIFSTAFHYKSYNLEKYYRDVLYTGNEFVTYYEKDSVGEIMSKKRWAKDIQSINLDFYFYSPLTSKKNYPLPDNTRYSDKKYSFQLVGEEEINDFSCYHIKMDVIPENDSTEMIQNIRDEINLWINKEDNIPVQYTERNDLVMNNDTMCQFEKYVLTKYELNNLKDNSQLELSSIPSFITLKDYIPYKSPELLAINTTAPGWSLTSLDNKTINLSDLKGELVLIDFFYKHCYPCMQALPALQDLHERYYDKGLRIIGIDPYDTKEKDDIDNFLANRGVSYTVLLGGNDVAEEYHISGYPTMYLIDKEGKIINIQVGYGDSTEEKLENIIKQNL